MLALGNPGFTCAQTGQGEDFYVSGTSDRITLELKGVDVIDVLKVLAKKSGLNIVAGKNVRGQVTLFLQNVDVKEALRVVLETSELAYEEENGIIKVVTLRDYEAKYGKPYDDRRVSEVITLKYSDAQSVSQFLNEIKTTVGKIVVDDRSNSLTLIDFPDSIKKMKEAIAKIDVPVSSKVFTLQYGDVTEIEPSITELLTPTIGMVKVDKRTNKIAIIDYPAKIRHIEQIVQAFDEKPRQVLIEAKIVQVKLDDQYAFGIDWDVVFERTKKSNVTLSQANLGGFASSPFASSASSLPSFTMNSTDSDFYAVISALEGMGKTNTLSSPRLSVLDGEEAKISVATQKPYVSQTVVQGDTTSTTADNIQFVDVGVIMTVRPKIADDGMILLKIKPEVSSSSEDFTLEQLDSNGNVTGTRTSVPIVTKQEVETTVLVADGYTVVLGGLIEDLQGKQVRKIPVLGDIPLLGGAFRHETVDTSKTELVIFMTPQIVAPTGDKAFNREYAKYLTQDGKFVKNTGGDEYSFTKAYKHSMYPFNKDNEPYWRDRSNSMSNALRSIALKNNPDTGTGTGISQERQMIEREHSAATSQGSGEQSPLAFYKDLITAQLNQALSRRNDLVPYRGTQGELALNVLRNGMVESVGFSKNAPFDNQDLRTIIRDVIKDIMPFPQFSNDISSDKEQFVVQISL